jgi:P-type conjugative transfer protein TrbL
MKKVVLIISLAVLAMIISQPAMAMMNPRELTKSLDLVEKFFLDGANSFEKNVHKLAEQLFFTLAGISLAWTAIEMALKRAEFGEIVSELTKFIIFTGLFLAFVKWGPQWAVAISQTLLQIGHAGSGFNNTVGSLGDLVAWEISSGIYMAILILSKAPNIQITDLSAAILFANVLLFIVAIFNFIVVVFLCIKLIVTQLMLYCQIYAGCFLLGFGGCKWTRDISIQYFKSVLATSAQFLVLFLLLHLLHSLNDESGLIEMFSNLAKSTDIDKIGDLVAPSLILVILPFTFLMIGSILPAKIGALISGNFISGNTAGAAALSSMVSSAGAATATSVNKAVQAAGSSYQNYQNRMNDSKESSKESSSGSDSSSGSGSSGGSPSGDNPSGGDSSGGNSSGGNSSGGNSSGGNSSGGNSSGGNSSGGNSSGGNSSGGSPSGDNPSGGNSSGGNSSGETSRTGSSVQSATRAMNQSGNTSGSAGTGANSTSASSTNSALPTAQTQQSNRSSNSSNNGGKDSGKQLSLNQRRLIAGLGVVKDSVISGLGATLGGITGIHPIRNFNAGREKFLEQQEQKEKIRNAGQNKTQKRGQA